MKLTREERTLRLTGWPKVLRLDRRDPSTAGADAIVPTHRAAADPIGRDAIARAARTLRRHGMPPERDRGRA